ncbi:hypothetical protein CBR_g19958 [Chara braunii]|uniref:Uncharacterized protein n=1 Tax=Chara braunii TaxID=69332 RepID=A0A388KZ46_CHABU|nr:hypothetical protein CBR_g19958 [Chara braunii]|eukprot:GBG75325.1 hypothetical protein CBR_g19958 [Chara braunii]
MFSFFSCFSASRQTPEDVPEKQVESGSGGELSGDDTGGFVCGECAFGWMRRRNDRSQAITDDIKKGGGGGPQVASTKVVSYEEEFRPIVAPHDPGVEDGGPVKCPPPDASCDQVHAANRTEGLWIGGGEVNPDGTLKDG